MFAAADSLITLLIIVGSIIFSLWRKFRGGDADETPAPPPARRPQNPSQRTLTWEEELQQLLKGASPKTPPVVRQAPPPISRAPVATTPPSRPVAPPPLILAPTPAR